MRIERWSALAGARFILALIVAVNHLAAYADIGILSFIPKLGAFEAILGFLLISGYSVSASYLKEPQGFLLRRFLRIYPIYVVSIAVTLCATGASGQLDLVRVSELFLNLAFLNQFLTNTSFVGPAWSLSLEVWLYCLAPALIALGAGWRRTLVWISFSSYAGYTLGRSAFHWPYYSGLAYGANLLLLSFAWICGLRLICEKEQRGGVLRDVRIMFAAHIAFASAIQLVSRIRHGALQSFVTEDVFTFVMQTFALIGIYFTLKKYTNPILFPNTSISRPLRFLGDISYPLYLTHIAFYELLQWAGLRSPYLLLGLAICGSAIIYLCVDFYSRKRHLGARQPRAVGAPSCPVPTRSGDA